MSYSENNRDEYSVEYLPEADLLTHSLYGRNYPEKDEAIIMQQDVDELLAPQELILQEALEEDL